MIDFNNFSCKLGGVFVLTAKDSVANEIVAYTDRDNLRPKPPSDILRELAKYKRMTIL